MALEWQRVERGPWSKAAYWEAADIARVDSYVVWADATEFRDILGELDEVEWLPLLAELREGIGAAQFAEDVDDDRYRKWLRVPTIYRNPTVDVLRNARYCTLWVTREFFRRWPASGFLNARLSRFELGLPVARPVEPPRQDPQPDKLSRRRRPTTFVATIDDNFAFAHARFREADALSTRIEALWLQDTRDNPPADLGYGHEIMGRTIDRWMGDAAPHGLVDEDHVYRLAAYRDATRRVAHGTVAVDLAAGEDPRALPEEAPRLLCVQFPARDNWGQMPLGTHVLDGLRYLIDRADRIAGHTATASNASVVVNLPHANLAGPHNGSSILERAMDELIALRNGAGMPLQIVLPAGNNYLSRCHARFALQSPPRARPDQTMQWRVLPDDATPNFLEIWLPDMEAAGVRVRVEPPAGLPASPSMRVGDVYTLGQGRDLVCTVVFLRRPGNGDRGMILVATAPTSTHRRRQDGRPAPAGAWNVTVTAARPETLIDAWIQRDDPVLGKLPYGRQSHFGDPAYERFERPSGRPQEMDNPASYVQRTGSINAIATGARTIVVGGYRRHEGSVARYAGSGPEPPGPLPDPTLPRDERPGPDIAAVSDESAVRRGVRAAAGRSGGTITMDGTSVAVAQVVRWLAVQMQAKLPPHDRKAVMDFVRNREQRPKPPRYKPLGSLQRAGVGRADLPPVRPKRGRGGGE